MPRFKVTKTIEIRAPIGRVFEVVSDPENILRLNLSTEGSLIRPSHIERITKGPAGEGSVWHFKGTFNGTPVEYDERVAVWAPPRKLVTELIGGPFKEIRWEHRLVPVRSGTKETHTVEYQPPDPSEVGFDKAGLRKQVSQDMEDALSRMKRFLERGGPP